jgi:hypothetical protein
MPVTIADTKSPEINIKNLRVFYNSTASLLENYIVGHAPEDAK